MGDLETHGATQRDRQRLSSMPRESASSKNNHGPAGASVPPHGGLGLLATLREDLHAHKGDWTAPGFQALVVYRLGRWGLQHANPLVGKLTGLAYQVLHRVARNLYGVELHRTAAIGRRVQFPHQGGITIGRYATLGDDCVIRQGVTVGNASNTSKEGWPVLGDRVSVGVGAVIFGRIDIGDDARVGPNAVVMQNVPAGATAFVPPARVAKPPQGDHAGGGAASSREGGTEPRSST